MLTPLKDLRLLPVWFLWVPLVHDLVTPARQGEVNVVKILKKSKFRYQFRNTHLFLEKVENIRNYCIMY